MNGVSFPVVVAMGGALPLLVLVFRVYRWWMHRPVEVVSREDMKLRSVSLGLVGEPDRLIRLLNGAIIPVEKKSNAREVYKSIEMQVGAYLLLVEDLYGRRPPFGLAVIAKDQTFRLPNTSALRRETRRVLERVKRQRATLDIPARATPFPKKCENCGYLQRCRQGQRVVGLRRWA